MKSCSLSVFYIKPQLRKSVYDLTARCSLSVFYIKPQPQHDTSLNRKGCSLSVFYIKPQHGRARPENIPVVPYQYSTSNRNYQSDINTNWVVVPYQYSTSNRNVCALFDS